MAKILIFNNQRDAFETYNRGENEPMPYSFGTTLLVREFRGSSKSPTLWTTTLAMESWNTTRRSYARSIPVGYAFKRIWEGGHGLQSQHYAGVAFDVGQTLTSAQRNSLRSLASSLNVWGYVEPANLTPTWVHFDRRRGKPACSTGYPLQKRGSRSNYVLTLQDGLNALGYNTGTLDGAFGGNTDAAVKNFQRNNGLTADGIVGCKTWQKLTAAVVGIGRTASVIN